MSAAQRASAVLVAGGRGVRFGGLTPKQFLPLAGRSLLLHGLAAIAELAEVQELILVLPEVNFPEDIDTLLLDSAWGPRRIPVRRVEAGARRQDSVAAGLEAVDPGISVVLVHDAARPFPPRKPMERLIEAAARRGGGLLAIPITDTVKRATPGHEVAETLDRRELWLAQTPQAIRTDHLPRVLQVLRGEKEMTDEAAALESLGIPVALIEGSPRNFKVTLPEDLENAERLLATQPG